MYETIRNPQFGSAGTGAEAAEIKAMREELAKAQQRAAAAEAQAETLAETNADLRARLDREGEDRRKLTAILTDQRPPAAATPQFEAPAVNPGRPWWRFWK